MARHRGTESLHEEVSSVWSAYVLGARLDQRFSTKEWMTDSPVVFLTILWSQIGLNKIIIINKQINKIFNSFTIVNLQFIYFMSINSHTKTNEAGEDLFKGMSVSRAYPRK